VTPAPSFPRIRRIDELWCKGERYLAAGLFVLMGLLVIARCVTKVFGNRLEWYYALVLFGVTVAAIRTRTVKEGEETPSWAATVGIAAAIAAAVSGAVYLYIREVPTGLLWAPKMSMVLMIWVAMLGTSIATYDRSHLALEMGEKLWPAKALRAVKALAHAVTAAFSVAMLIVSIDIVRYHHGRGDNVADAVTATDPIPIIDHLPRWVAFLVLAYGFAAMSVRFLAQAVTTATGTEAPMEERLPS